MLQAKVRLTRWGLAVVACCVVLGFGAAPALAETFVVDAPNPELECPVADFPSINGAVTAADPGDVIQVCPGLYLESVTVPKTVRLLGSGPEPRQRSGDPREEAVVGYGASVGFEVAAQGVVIDGFTIQGTGMGTGVRTSPAFSGYIVQRNLLHQNLTDLTLRSSGAEETLVQHNAFNNESDTTASASRFAISNLSFGESSLVNAQIRQNSLTKHGAPFSSGILLVGVARVTFEHNLLVDDSEVLISAGADITVSHNRTFRSTSSGIRVFDSARLHVMHNDVEEAAGAGIVVGDEEAGDGAVIAHNRVTANTAGGLTVVRSSGVIVEHNEVRANQVTGMRVSFGGGNLVRHNTMTANAAGLNILLETGTQVENNVVRENERNGILIAGSMGSLVEHNVATANGLDGILLRASSDTLVRANHSNANGKDGIEAEATSVGNTILNNHTLQNVEHDCHDDSIGPGTSGTGNIWLENKGKTENRPGLCEGARVTALVFSAS